MRAGTGSRGYTIIETMVFLAVSGVMFVIAASFINGKQAKAELNQGINGANSTVQQVINDVGNGTYDSQGSFTCQSSPSGLNITANPAPQGTNGGLNQAGCVFLGKVIELGNDTDNTAYEIYTVAGSQYASGGIGPDSPANYTGSLPKVVDSLTYSGKLLSGLTVSKMVDNSGSPACSSSSLNAIGFFGSFSQYNGSTSNGSAQTVNVVPFCGAVSDKTSDTIGRINTASNYNSAANVNITICFDGGTGNFAALTIGGQNGQRLTTSQTVSTNASSIGC